MKGDEGTRVYWILNLMVDEEEAMERLIGFLDEDSVKEVYTPNPEIVMLAQKDKELFDILNNADLVLADGIGLIIASRLKASVETQVTGVDTWIIIEVLCGKSEIIFYVRGKSEPLRRPVKI